MRVLLGLASLAAAVNGQVAILSGSQGGSLPTAPGVGQTALAIITARDGISSGSSISAGSFSTVSPAGFVNVAGNYVPTNNYAIYVVNSVSAVVFTFQTNSLTGQLQYRWAPNYPNPALAYPNNNLNSLSYTCDLCAGGSPVSCNTSVGPGGSPSPLVGWPCASFTRTITFQNLVATPRGASQPTVNSISVQLFDINQNPAPDTTSYSFQVIRAAPTIAGDPQITGLQGQDFQVHGTPDEIFNMITYPNLQVNARFVYLSSAACHDNFTACFAHPGTYISEEGIKLGSDKIHVAAGSYKKGLTVSVNGQRVTARKTAVKLGSVELVSHRQVVVNTPIMTLTISNSDKFLNQESHLLDAKLLALGRERRVLGEGEAFHSEIPLHGLQGQTWRNVEYPSGLEYEGSIQDYHVTDGNLFGSKFVFNQFKH